MWCLAPPLTVYQDEIDLAISIMDESLAPVGKGVLASGVARLMTRSGEERSSSRRHALGRCRRCRSCAAPSAATLERGVG